MKVRKIVVHTHNASAANMEINTGVPTVSDEHRELIAHFVAHYRDKGVGTVIRLVGDYLQADLDAVVNDIHSRVQKYAKQ